MKKTLDGLSLFIVFPMFISWKIHNLIVDSSLLFVSYAQLLSLFPGKSGVFLRRAFYRLTLESCGNNLNIGFGSFFSHSAANIGNDVYIGSYCIVGMVLIGDGTMVGSNVDILSGKKQHTRDETGQLLGSDLENFSVVNIGKNTWVGNSSVILANVGDNCTVGAGSVVVKQVESNLTVVGNPAKSI